MLLNFSNICIDRPEEGFTFNTKNWALPNDMVRIALGAFTKIAVPSVAKPRRVQPVKSPDTPRNNRVGPLSPDCILAVSAWIVREGMSIKAFREGLEPSIHERGGSRLVDSAPNPMVILSGAGVIISARVAADSPGVERRDDNLPDAIPDPPPPILLGHCGHRNVGLVVVKLDA